MHKPAFLLTSYSSGLIENQQQVDVATNAEISTDLFSQYYKRAYYKPKLQVDLRQIRGPTGSVRGHKDVVKRSLENIKTVATRPFFRIQKVDEFSLPNLSSFISHSLIGNYQLNSILDETYKEEYLSRLVEDEQDQCVAYTTTLGVVRRTFEDSKQMRSILNLNLIKYEERDIFLNQEYKQQLKLRCNEVIVPVLFVDGHLLGGIKELESLNENKALAKKLARFKMSVAPKGICSCCGNARFIACQSCNGSRKSAIHHFKFNSVALRCIRCDRNDGLIQCPKCSVLASSVDCNNNSNNNNADEISPIQKIVTECSD